MFLQFSLEVLLHEGGRSERGPQDVDPVGIGPLGALVWGVERIFTLNRFGETSVRDIVEGEDVHVLATGVGLKEGYPTGPRGWLHVNSILGCLRRETSLKHRKSGESVYNLGKN